MPWEAIKYVGSGLTLAAFVVAAIAWILKSKSEEREKLIGLAKEDERAALVRDTLEFFRVDTGGLTKAQQYQLALEQIQARSQRFKIVAVIVCIIAVLGAAVAAYAITHSSGTSSNGPTNVTSIKDAQDLTDHARRQLKAQEYAGAWNSIEQAVKLNPASAEAQEEQVDVVMAWLRQWFDAPQAVWDKLDDLTACLRTAALKAKGARAADIHAHLGWGNFLKRLEDAEVEGEFEKAVAADPKNPFANAMWGYWLVTKSPKPKEGKARFQAALESGRQKEYARWLQLSAWRRFHDNEGRLELIQVADDMRRQKESMSRDSKSRLFSDIYVYPDAEFLRSFQTVLPVADHLATFVWLAEGEEDDSLWKTFFLARLLEATGDSAKALSLYRTLLAQPTFLESQVKEGISRLKGGSPSTTSETSALLAEARSGDTATRAKLIASLARADVNTSEALPALVAWVKDPDKDIRAAACETLVQYGRIAVPAVVPLLSSNERREVMNAAAILGKIGLEPKLVVPALGKALENPDVDVRGKVIEALERFGPDAEPAVAPLIQMLTKTVQTDLQIQIAYALGEIGPAAKDAVPQLIELLKSNKDRKGFLNVVAADALGKIGPAASNAVPGLIAALKSDDVRLPTRAEEALGNIGAGAWAAIPALIEALKFTEKKHWDNCVEPVGKIAEALANRGDTSALPVLKKAMASLEAANVEPKYITPVREAIDVLKEKEVQSKPK